MSAPILFQGKVGRKYCIISPEKWIIDGKEYAPQDVSSVVWNEYKPSKFTTFSGYILFILSLFLMIVDTVEFWEIIALLFGIYVIFFKTFIKTLYYMRAVPKSGFYKFIVFSKSKDEIINLLFACDKCLSQNEDANATPSL